MAKKRTKPQLTGRALKDALMPRAKEIAAVGGCVRWTDVLKDFTLDERTALKLYATATDVDAIDRICLKARNALKRTLR